MDAARDHSGRRASRTVDAGRPPTAPPDSAFACSARLCLAYWLGKDQQTRQSHEEPEQSRANPGKAAAPNTGRTPRGTTADAARDHSGRRASGTADAAPAPAGRRASGTVDAAPAPTVDAGPAPTVDAGRPQPPPPGSAFACSARLCLAYWLGKDQQTRQSYEEPEPSRANPGKAWPRPSTPAVRRASAHSGRRAGPQRTPRQRHSGRWTTPTARRIQPLPVLPASAWPIGWANTSKPGKATRNPSKAGPTQARPRPPAPAGHRAKARADLHADCPVRGRGTAASASRHTGRAASGIPASPSALAFRASPAYPCFHNFRQLSETRPLGGAVSGVSSSIGGNCSETGVRRARPSGGRVGAAVCRGTGAGTAACGTGSAWSSYAGAPRLARRHAGTGSAWSRMPGPGASTAPGGCPSPSAAPVSSRP